MKLTSTLLFTAVLALAAATAQSQEYPSKPVRVVVPFPPGGILELITRAVTDKVGASWGQPIIIEPRPGASGNIGAQFARKIGRASCRVTRGWSAGTSGLER